MKIDSANDVGDRVERGGRRATEEGGRSVARLENARDTEVGPGSGKVREILPPFFALGIWVASVDEAIHPPILAKVVLVIDAILLVGDLLVDLQEGGSWLSATLSAPSDGEGRRGRCFGVLPRGMGTVWPLSSWTR